MRASRRGAAGADRARMPGGGGSVGGLGPLWAMLSGLEPAGCAMRAGPHSEGAALCGSARPRYACLLLDRYRTPTSAPTAAVT